MSTSGIYEIRNIQNNHIYIGSSIDIEKRWKEHVHKLRGGKHHSNHLQNAYNKYGKDAFIFTVIESCSIDMLLVQEQKYIDLLCPEYNISPTAGRPLGIKRSEETRLKLSIAKKGKASTRKGKKGKPHSEETKNKIGESNKGKHFFWQGKTHSEETKLKMSESAKGKNTWMKGVRLSPETRAKIGEASKLMWKRRREGLLNE